MEDLLLARKKGGMVIHENGRISIILFLRNIIKYKTHKIFRNSVHHLCNARPIGWPSNPIYAGTWGLRVRVGLDRMGRKNWGKIPSISALNYELTNHTQFISFPPFMPIFDLRNCPLICCCWWWWWWWCWELWRKVQRTRNAEQVSWPFLRC